MTTNYYKISVLIRRLTYRYNKMLKEGKGKDLWEFFLDITYNSIPIVYPNWDELELEFEKEYLRRKRVKRRVKKYIQGMFNAFHEEKLFFLTFTFSEHAMSLTERTRYVYVSRYLNEHCIDFIANRDYGDKTHREHYHAVVASEFIKTDFLGGHIHFKHIRTRNASRLSSYLNKLVNHSQKYSAGKVFRKRGLVEMDELPF